MTILRSGASQKYSNNWSTAFGSKKRKAKKASVSGTAKPAKVKKKAAKKKKKA